MTFTDSTAVFGATCSVEMRGNVEASYFAQYGTKSQAAANKARCTTAGGAVTDLTCGEALFSTWNGLSSTDLKKRVLVFCCGGVAGFPESKALNSPQSGGKVTYAYYTDNACTTLAKKSTLDYDTSLDFSGDDATVDWNVDSCYETNGGGRMIRACNGTEESGHILYEHYADATCTSAARVEAGITSQKKCSASGEGNSTNYQKLSCAGGAAVANLIVQTRSEAVLTGIPSGLSKADRGKVRNDVCDAVKVAATEASSLGEKKVASCDGTGNLADISARRLAQRRLASHAGTSVITLLETTVPTADAAALKTALDTAVSSPSGKLSAGELATAIQNKLKAEGSPVKTANITATPTVTNMDPIIPPKDTPSSPPSGTTSSASTEFLSWGVGLAVAATLAM